MAERIVILGGGFAGAYCARRLDRAARRGEIELTLVDRNNFFVFHPLLVEAGTGALEPRHVVVPLRPFAPHARLVMGEARDIDLDSRKLSVEILGGSEPLELGYDHLVFAPGSVTKMPDIPGLAEHAFEMKGLEDAITLRDRAVQLVESADAIADEEERRRLLHLVVVGGNYTGVELAGEMHAFMQKAARACPRVDPDEVRVTLIELTDRILPVLDHGLAEYAAEKLRGRGLEILLENTATKIDERGLELREGGRLESATIVWAAGIAPSPLSSEVELPNDKGWIRCAPDMRIEGLEREWAIGDAAQNPDPEGNPYPPTAQHAVREGEHLAENLLASVRGKKTRPFSFSALGTLAPLGKRRAVADVLGVRVSGFPAWFLFRTVYLFKMPGLSRKLRVAADWTLDLFLGRELLPLGIHRQR